MASGADLTGIGLFKFRKIKKRDDRCSSRSADKLIMLCKNG